MWFDESNAYKAGTFKLGQEVWHIRDVEHKFRFHKECTYCDSTGKVLIKGREFTCPNCNAAIQTKEVIERVAGDSEKIKSVIGFKNRNKSLEIYVNDASGYGVIIQRQSDGSSRYFESREQAEIECQQFNALHGVYRQIEEYSNRKDRIFD